MRLNTGAMVARLAENAADVARAQELRHLCFLVPRGLSRPNAREVDRFDDLCQHVLIEGADGRLLGCFRVLIMRADQIQTSYSAQFYDLGALAAGPGQLLELGRFCTHPEATGPDVLRLSLAAITRLVEEHGVTWMIGCSSFPGADMVMHAPALAYLRRNHLAPKRLAPARKGAVVSLPDEPMTSPAQGLAGLPPLLRSYLALGGWVSDHLVIDPELDTLHVFTAVEVAGIPPARASALRALAR